MVPLLLLIIIVRFEGSMLFEKGIPTCYYHQFSTCLFECMAKIFCYSIRPKMDDVFLFFTNLFMYMSKLFHLYSDGIDSIFLFSGFRKIELNSQPDIPLLCFWFPLQCFTFIIANIGYNECRTLFSK